MIKKAVQKVGQDLLFYVAALKKGQQSCEIIIISILLRSDHVSVPLFHVLQLI